MIAFALLMHGPPPRYMPGQYIDLLEDLVDDPGDIRILPEPDRRDPQLAEHECLQFLVHKFYLPDDLRNFGAIGWLAFDAASHHQGSGLHAGPGEKDAFRISLSAFDAAVFEAMQVVDRCVVDSIQDRFPWPVSPGSNPARSIAKIEAIGP